MFVRDVDKTVLDDVDAAAVSPAVRNSVVWNDFQSLSQQVRMAPIRVSP